MNTSRLFMLAWRIVPRLPEGCTRVLFDVVGQLAHAVRLRSVRQLEANLARVRPDLRGRALRRVSRAGMRAYLRYFGEVLTLRAVPEEQLRHRLRLLNPGVATEYLHQGRSVVAALGHTGNWDLAGAWCGRYLARVLTVAEVLEPPELFEQFQSFRADLGMDVLGLTRDGSVLPTLARMAHEHTYLVPLLADRDLSRTSIEAAVGAHRMRVAAGPAVLAEAMGAPLVQVFIRHERLRGKRRRLAGTRWGLVAELHPVQVADDVAPPERVRALTQAWVDVLMERIRAHPDQWHMLSKVFTEDLDAARLARAHARQARRPAGGGSAAPSAAETVEDVRREGGLEASGSEGGS